MSPEPLRPGDVLVCSSCGARSAPLWHTGAQHADGWPLLATWGARTHVVQGPISGPWSGRCPACPGDPVAEPLVERAAAPANCPPIPLLDLDGKPLQQLGGSGSPVNGESPGPTPSRSAVGGGHARPREARRPATSQSRSSDPAGAAASGTRPSIPPSPAREPRGQLGLF